MRKKAVCKSILFVCLTMLLIGFSVTSAMPLSAAENAGAPAFASRRLAGGSTVSVKQTVTIGGKEYPLYCTFDDQDEAIANIAQEAAPLLALLQNVYGLDAFSAETVCDYYFASLELLNDPEYSDDYTESNPAFRKLRSFYDIYENEEKNAQILSDAAQASDSSQPTVSFDSIVLLPYESFLSAAADNGISTQPSASTDDIVLDFNTEEGIAYATQYATSPNTSAYYYFNKGDCTNFVSQILENGGIGQITGDSTLLGWWHKVSYNWLGIASHTHSLSWTMADTFSRYMGIGATESDHINFSRLITKGDFIAADFEGDGDWDHMGFVTEHNQYPCSMGYYDYKVAQHTTNYHAWVSSAQNSWETIEDDYTGEEGAMLYARIRR